MRLQSVNSYAKTQNQPINQSKTKQQQFGRLIIDESHLESMPEKFKPEIRKVLSELKSMFFGEDKALNALATQTERDVLIHPFKSWGTIPGGIEVNAVDKRGRIENDLFWADGQFGGMDSESIRTFITKCLLTPSNDRGTTFPEGVLAKLIDNAHMRNIKD